MNITIINKWDISGGAARAAYRLVVALQNSGKDVHYLVGYKQSSGKNVVELNFKVPEKNFFQEVVQEYYIDECRNDVSNTFYSFTYSSLDKIFLENINKADIINLHWIEKLISIDDLQRIVNLNKPIVWTLHDERPFTGGCHYTSGCNKFEKGNCLNCEQLIKDDMHLPNIVLKTKLKILNNANLTIVTPSKWLAKQAKKSELFSKHRIEVIPNSIETNIFFESNKKYAKSKLGIQTDVTTLMFGAQNNGEIRKGFVELLIALKQSLKDKQFADACAKKKIKILILGDCDIDIKNLGIEYSTFGFVKDDEKIALIYNATDIFILPSLEDNLPNTVLESMACATPVIAFNIGGVPDMVKHNETGLLVNKGDCEALSKALISLIFDQEKRILLGKNSSKIVKEHYSLKVQSDRYLHLFSELASEKKENAPRLNYHFDDLFYPIFKYAVMQKIDVGNRKSPDVNYSLDDFCQTSFARHPIKKIKAYNLLNRAYFKKT